MRSSNKSGWLLVVCGAMYALFSGILIAARNPDGAHALREWLHTRDTLVPLGTLALLAGVCAAAAGVMAWRRRENWFLALSGLISCALGLLIFMGRSRPVSFRSIAGIVAAMALSMAIYEVATARKLRGHATDEWLTAAAGVFSLAFAGAFLGFALRWLKLYPGPSAQTFYWLGSYFAFSACCMLGLSFLVRRLPDGMSFNSGSLPGH